MPENLIIRNAVLEDLDAICALENACFPKAEAASRADFEKRLTQYPNHFWILEQSGKIRSMINGMVTNTPNLADEMYHHANLHEEAGRWQMIFGVETHPDFRRKGYAGMLLHRCIEQAQQEGRAGLVLTCKKEKIAYYEAFGFFNEGISASVHGQTVWYQMRRKCH